MVLFINERSLHNQYNDIYQFIESIKVFLKSIEMIDKLKQEKEVFKSANFFYYTGINNSHLQSVLKNDHNLNTVFFQNLQKLNPKNWEDNKVHNESSIYLYQDSDYAGSSVAELAEIKLLNSKSLGFLLNFSDSIFGESYSIDIIKDNQSIIPVNCVFDVDSIYNWLFENKLIPEGEYDEQSGIPPTDQQTVLKDAQIFEPTLYPKNNSRRVYRRKGTNQLWVVDGAIRHANNKAHIEIFDETTGKHIGTSLYNKIEVDDNYKKSKRTINLK